MDRYEGKFNLSDTSDLVRVLGKASDSQLYFWYHCARKNGLSHQAGLIRAEIVDRLEFNDDGLNIKA